MLIAANFSPGAQVFFVEANSSDPSVKTQVFWSLAFWAGQLAIIVPNSVQKTDGAPAFAGRYSTDRRTTETPARSTMPCWLRVAGAPLEAARAGGANSNGNVISSPPSMERKGNRLPLRFASIKRCVLFICASFSYNIPFYLLCLSKIFQCDTLADIGVGIIWVELERLFIGCEAVLIAFQLRKNIAFFTPARSVGCAKKCDLFIGF